MGMGMSSSYSSSGTSQEKPSYLPPVNSDRARELVRILEESHRVQMEEMSKKEYTEELNFQAKIVKEVASKETYSNWKSKETDDLIQHLIQKTQLPISVSSE